MVKTSLLLAVMTSLFIGFGLLMGGLSGALLAFVFAAVMNMFAYWNADKIVLRMQNAKLVDHRCPELNVMVSKLSQRAGIPTPKCYVIDTEQPNAFATGRNPENAAVAITTGLMHALSRDEQEAVMAHEIAHVVNRDTLIMTMTATIAGAISMMANFFFLFGSGHRENNNIIAGLALMILAPFAAMIVQMAISRTREYSADELGAKICGNPRALASALQKIENLAHVQGRINQPAEDTPAMAHMYIINPLLGGQIDNLFSTHPNTQNRIDALQKMSEEAVSTDDFHQPFVKEQTSKNMIWSPQARKKQRLTKGPWA